MSQILVEFDHNIQLPDIIIPLVNTSEKEAGPDSRDNVPGIQQTLVHGIMSPLVKINNVVIDFNDVVDFSLKSTSTIPTISITVRDKYKLLNSIDVPGNDNVLQLQILPRFDNAYKKINLLFYLTNIKSHGGFVTASGTYKLSPFTAAQYKSFGEIDTYTLCTEISKETGLGFATNVQSNEADKRFMYCDYKSYQDLLDYEIKHAGDDVQICDYWIDFWNNLVLADIYERYNAIDTEDDMLVWVSTQNKEVGEGMEMNAVQVAAVLNNHPGAKTSELYVKNYTRVNKGAAQIFNGTDRIYSSFSMNDDVYSDYLIQDGDVKKDIFVKYEYVGECYGTKNYFLADRKRKDFLQKVNSETIEITLTTPLLGLMRGQKVNFVWYINDSMFENKQDSFIKSGLINDTSLEIPLDPEVELKNPSNGHFIEDKSVSGQYLITGCNMKFNGEYWEYVLTLSRPATQKSVIINE